MKKPVKVVVTGAAGQIGYSLLFRIGAVIDEANASELDAAHLAGSSGNDDFDGFLHLANLLK